MKNFLLSLLLASTCAVATNAADWGTVKGKFTYDGDVPKSDNIQVTKDVQFCGKHDLKVEELIVNPKNKGIANVVVYLYQKRNAKPPKIHPDYEETEKGDVVLDNENCRFEPHIALVRTSQTLIIGNKDPIAHNASLAMLANPPSNNIIPHRYSDFMKTKITDLMPSHFA